MTSWQDQAPWGRPPVRDVPVPPFADAAEARLFRRLLATWVAALGTGAPVTLPAFAMADVLQGEADALRHSEQPLLTPLALRVAVTTFFPVPWTPHGLAAELARAPWSRDRWQVAPDVLRWGTDPDYVARRSPEGTWQVVMSERGVQRVELDGLPDDDMVLALMAHQWPGGVPYGHGGTAEDLAVLAPALPATQEHWARRAALPYLASWQD